MRRQWLAVRAWIERLEDLPIGPGALVATLAGVIALRNVLELIVARNPVFEPLAAFVHYPLAYVAPFALLSLVLAAWSGVAPGRVARLMLFAWFITLLPPLADLVLHRAKDAPTIGYLQGDPSDLAFIVLHFFDPRVALTGTTPGIRLEIAVAVLLGGAYVLIRSGSWRRALGAAVTLYPASLFFLTLPLLVEGAFRLVRPTLTQNDLLRGEGIFARGDLASAPDSVSILWLLPLLALVLAVAARMQRGATPAEARPKGPAAGLGAFLVLCAAAGTIAAIGLHLPSAAPLMLAPFDLLGALGAAGLLLALCAACPPAAGFSPRRVALLAYAFATALALGRAAGLAFCATAGALAALDAPWIPARLHGAVRAAVASVAALGALCGGYALVVGPEALARIPYGFVLAALAAGAAVGWSPGPRPAWLAVRAVALGVALGAGGAALGGAQLGLVAFACGTGAALLALPGDRAAGATRSAPFTPLTAGLALVLLVRVAAVSEATHAELQEQARCVARLAVVHAKDCEQKGQWDNARTQYLEALRCDPQRVDALEGLALLYIRQEKKLDRGIGLLEKACELAPRAVRAHANLASAYLDKGRAADALERVDQALAVDPREIAALYTRALVLEALGRRAEAIEAWRRYEVRAAGHPAEATGLALALRRRTALEAPASP